jgi:transcription-repair coupling factor (superfamily II helicase)
VRFAVAHGQMGDEQLERVLVEFIERQHDVLVSTAIIESGVDLPNVNTMIVDRADLFGVAQLYQLRGRVGRSDRRAACLLLVPDGVSREARRRLGVIVDNQRLGSGFSVASADLELRGGGNLLGAAQAGNIDKVGYETWLEILEQAVHAARGDQDRRQIEPEVEVPVDAFIPDVLVRDPQERLGWYQRLAEADREERVEACLDELESEYGDLPEAARNLGALMSVRLACRALGIERASWLKVRVTLQLHPSSPLDDATLAAVVSRHPKRFEVSTGVPRTFTARFTPRDAERPLRYLRWVLANLERRDEA